MTTALTIGCVSMVAGLFFAAWRLSKKVPKWGEKD